MSIALAALFAAAFVIGTSEFVIAGILPALASDLSVSIPAAGLLVSFYALGVAIGGPMLALMTGRFERRSLIVIYVAFYTVGHVFCALAPNYTLLMAARFGVSLVHGAYFGTAMVLAGSLAPEGRRAFAVALVFAGLTVANIIGVPLGTVIGNAYGWRMTFWAIAGLGAVALALITFLVPAGKAEDASRGNILADLRALTRAPVWTSLAIIVLQAIGMFALFTFITPLLVTVTGMPAARVPWLLLVFGVGSTIGILVGGRLADWRLMPSLIGSLTLQVLTFGAIGLFSAYEMPMYVLVLAWGALGFSFGAPVQARILASARDAPALAANLIPSAFNIAIAAGAWLGGVLLDRGAPYTVLPWLACGAAALATLVAVLAAQQDRRVALAAA